MENYKKYVHQYFNLKNYYGLANFHSHSHKRKFKMTKFSPMLYGIFTEKFFKNIAGRRWLSSVIL